MNKRVLTLQPSEFFNSLLRLQNHSFRMLADRRKRDRSRTFRCGEDVKVLYGCPPRRKSKILYGVFPEDIEEAAEMLAGQ